MAGHWNSEYYDNLEFFYFEPQHLGKIKNPNSEIQSPKDAIDHLKRMEVCLNHQMNLFFRLAPLAYQQGLFRQCFGADFDDQWSLVGKELDREWKVDNGTQPDLFFAGRTTNVCIELKLGSKLTLEQVLKYVFLNKLEQRHSGLEKRYYLLFMGKGEFRDQWREKFEDTKAMSLALRETTFSGSLKRWASKIMVDEGEIGAAADKTAFSFLSYQGFASSLAAFKKDIDGASPHSETIVELFNGMLAELRERRLATEGPA